MGCCFSDSTAEEGKPLLGGHDSRVSTDSVPQMSPPAGYVNENYRYIDKPAQSARRFRPPDSPTTAKMNIREIKMKHIGVREVDKRLEDHASLYNTQVVRWRQLEDALVEMKGMLPDVNTGSNLQDLFYHIKIKLASTGEALESLVIKRRFQFCMEIQYDDKLIDYTILPAFLSFNQANRLVKEILDKGPPIVSSIQLVVKDEKNLRRDVMVASLGADGPDCLKACMENVADLRRAIELVEDIKRGTLARFEELKASVTPLTTEKQ